MWLLTAFNSSFDKIQNLGKRQKENKLFDDYVELIAVNLKV